ncbi:hypothetical protein D1872_272600 [compost metagenome]
MIYFLHQKKTTLTMAFLSLLHRFTLHYTTLHYTTLRIIDCNNPLFSSTEAKLSGVCSSALSSRNHWCSRMPPLHSDTPSPDPASDPPSVHPHPPVGSGRTRLYAFATDHPAFQDSYDAPRYFDACAIGPSAPCNDPSDQTDGLQVYRVPSDI